jgi:hypothetical protein
MQGIIEGCQRVYFGVNLAKTLDISFEPAALNLEDHTNPFSFKVTGAMKDNNSYTLNRVSDTRSAVTYNYKVTSDLTVPEVFKTQSEFILSYTQNVDNVKFAYVATGIDARALSRRAEQQTNNYLPPLSKAVLDNVAAQFILGVTTMAAVLAVLVSLPASFASFFITTIECAYDPVPSCGGFDEGEAA